MRWITVDDGFVEISIRTFWTLVNRDVRGRRLQVGISLFRWERFRGPWPRESAYGPVLYEWQLGPIWVRRFHVRVP